MWRVQQTQHRTLWQSFSQALHKGWKPARFTAERCSSWSWRQFPYWPSDCHGWWWKFVRSVRCIVAGFVDLGCNRKIQTTEHWERRGWDWHLRSPVVTSTSMEKMQSTKCGASWCCVRRKKFAWGAAVRNTSSTDVKFICCIVVFDDDRVVQPRVRLRVQHCAQCRAHRSQCRQRTHRKGPCDLKVNETCLSEAASSGRDTNPGRNFDLDCRPVFQTPWRPLAESKWRTWVQRNSFGRDFQCSQRQISQHPFCLLFQT